MKLLQSALDRENKSEIMKSLQNRNLFYLFDVVRRGDLSELKRFLMNTRVDLNIILSCKDIALLHFAVGVEPVHKSIEFTEILLKHGADPNICAEDGITPVHIAAIWGRLINLKLLVACGGDPSLKDDERMTAFDYAAREEQWDVYDYLYNVIDDSTEPFCSDQPSYSLNLNRVLVSTDDVVAEYDIVTHNKIKDISLYTKSDMVREWCEKTTQCSNYMNRLYPTILNATYLIQDESMPWKTTDFSKTKDLSIDESKTSFKTCISKKISNKDIDISGIEVLELTRDTNKFDNFAVPALPKPGRNQIESIITDDDSEVSERDLTDDETQNIDSKTLSDAVATMQNETNEWLSQSSSSESSFTKETSNTSPIYVDSSKSDIFTDARSIIVLNRTPISIDTTNECSISYNAKTIEISDDIFSSDNTKDLSRKSNILTDISNRESNKSSGKENSTESLFEESRKSRNSGDLIRTSCENHRKFKDRENSTLSHGKQSRKSNDSNVSCGSIVVASVQEDYKYEDKTEDVELIERRLLLPSLVVPLESSEAENQSLNDSLASSLPASIDYDVDTLRLELTRQGFNPGPINSSTKRLYLKKLKTLKKYPINVRNEKKAPYSVELEKTLRNEDWFEDLPNYYQLEEKVRNDFANPKVNRHLREGHSKTSFTYLLLDPRVTDNLPGRANQMSKHQVWKTFVDSIFYVGKGKRSRPYSHLYQALTLWKRDFRSSQDKKIQRILDIWNQETGVICLHIFQNIIPAEAFTYEASMIDVLGAGNLCNIRPGNYYGACASWPMKERRWLGVCLLYKALNVFLSEGERRLMPTDI